MPKNWKLKSKIPQDLAAKLSDYPLFLSQLLYNRGLLEKDKIADFLESEYENLHSPFLFKDMQKAADRIWQAIDQRQKITIYGDYDADAVTANAVLQQTFRHLGVNVESYIPDRFTEGYGINTDALLKIKDKGSKIIITVDCGTNSTDAAEFCSQNNIDLIITDHHELIGELPKAYALINPKNKEDNYPYSEITGVGVAFKLACAILSQTSKIKDKGLRIIPGYEKWLLDLVAIGTVADCHSLLGENRILVKYGLKVLQKTKWAGLRALIASSGLDFTQKPPDTYTLGFIIAPRLNAAGRLEHANVALELLMEKDSSAALNKAQELERINLRRQEQTARIVSEAKEQALLHQDRKILVLAGEGWNKGVVGLVAGRLAEEFYKPVIVLEKSFDFSTGSARTVGGFNILEAIKFSAEHTVRFGGHKQAAGLTIKTSEIEYFYRKILEFAEKETVDNQRILELEAELDESQLSPSSVEGLRFLEPFGVNNPRPKFLVSQMKITSLKVVGSAQNHTQLNLQKGLATVPAIIFNSNLLEKNFKVGDTVDVACELMEDGWNGRKGVKLKIVDLKFTQ